MEALHKQAPPTLAVAEINRPIHRLYPFFLQPFLGGVEKHIRGLLVIDAFEEAAPAHGKFVALESLCAVECCDAADETACIVAQQPPGTTTALEARIGIRVEYLVHVVVKRPDIMRVIVVKRRSHRYKRLG